MTKGELVKLLEPYTDDMEIVVRIPMGDKVYKSLAYGRYIHCERIGGFFQEGGSPSKSEGCLWLS